MDPEASPPKRVTRARAAAKKAPDNGVKVATAAAKAKATRTMPAAMTKRKTRADEAANDDNNNEDELTAPEPEKPRATRGRPRKAAMVQAEPEPEVEKEVMVVVPKTRGRPKKVVEENEIEAAPAVEAPRTRARGRKVAVADEHAPPVSEAPKKIVRGRQATVTKPTAAPKKSVKFQDTAELDKENAIPTTKGKAPVATVTGLRAKPVRKPAAAPRVTRGRARATSESDQAKPKSPLSPKKVTQVAVAKDVSSDDELATMEKTPMKPLIKSPMKPRTNILSSAKRLDFTTSIVANRAVTAPQDFTSSMMASPARRIPQSPWRETLGGSPKRTGLGEAVRSPFKSSMPPPSSTKPSFKASLLQSPAKRPPSPTKISAGGSPTRTASGNLFNATPKPNTFSISRFTTPRTLTKSAFRPGRVPFSSVVKPATESRLLGKDQAPADGASIKPFPGRLSAVLPRHADPTMDEAEVPAGSTTPKSPVDNAEEVKFSLNVLVQESTTMDCADDVAAMVVEELQSTTPSVSPSSYSIGSFGLRPDKEDPFQDSDSEDELASASPLYSPSPIGALKMSFKDFAMLSTPKKLSFGEKTPVAKSSAQIGFTPLAKQLDSWMTPVDPQPEIVQEEYEEEPELVVTPNVEEQAAEQSPVPTSFFEDEMIVREEADIESEHDLKEQVSEAVELTPAEVESENEPEDEVIGVLEFAAAEPEPEHGLEDTVMEAIEFAPAELDDEDLALAAEADELSLIEEENANSNDVLDLGTYAVEDEAVSEASQEYGDENMVPIDPELLTLGEQVVLEQHQEPSVETVSNVVPETEVEEHHSTSLSRRADLRSANPFTPARPTIGRSFHTVCKVPLKAEGAESPIKPSPRKRPASASRVTAHRTAPPPPTIVCHDESSTPVASTNWSTSATPTRTPRRDLDNRVLRGAVVYVDVHTSEGADASAVFVELLTQMGAKCVKSWGWKPNTMSPPGGVISPETAESAKVGITHVVFKDGGKRTLEKVRETNGVVLCVGVGWVLDCERMDQWLDESPYSIDTAIVPRGGNRRRKSMEPRALANMNGTLVSTPGRASSKEPTAPATARPARIGRRESTQWIRTPRSAEAATSTQDQDVEMNDYTMAELSPLPTTPSAEALSMYAEHILDNEGRVEETPYYSGREKEELVMRTMPANKMVVRDQDGPSQMGSEALMQRLMMARRKSLQWAPKVGSPLARQ
ncbi:hypothetical protein VC83_03315 [Pseudogymnoascus destructans]|uniref:BRCT domain-containing protein n=2 Tax=Pseudogymnoascus destructans TaxID=655981 RepID=L8FXW1_PSED2|nr:uncharacterized protein VC83_03315 [Pseudogymnoascus destructans]ELR05672.1 hypothetical protein GMDG_07515 [Pseudogymnoascus destructans 20631-21]OAF60576.1 hypothetical protein VC83_03315 [Pseudogymnoascus destructans]